MLRKLYHNPRLDWHKINLKFFFGCKKVLDVGCGNGLFVGLDPDRITGLDKNWHSLKQCAGSGYTVIGGDALNLPFDDESFDGVYCADVIEHFSTDNLRRLLIEMLRVLGAGGLLVIATPLPSKIFWNDATHTRPYPPQALLSYFLSGESKGTQSIYKPLPYQVKFIKLKYRYTQFCQLPLCLYFEEDRIKISNLIKPSALLFILANLAYRVGISFIKPEGYVIAIKKV